MAIYKYLPFGNFTLWVAYCLTNAEGKLSGFAIKIYQSRKQSMQITRVTLWNSAIICEELLSSCLCDLLY